MSVYVFEETNVFSNKVTIELPMISFLLKEKMLRQTCPGEGLPQYSRRGLVNLAVTFTT